MSKYEYERGDLLLPSASFAKLRRTVCEGYNAWQQHGFTVATRIHEEVAAAIKGKRLPDVRGLVRQAVDRAIDRERPAAGTWYDSSRPGTSSRPYHPRIGEAGRDALMQALLKTDPTTRRDGLRRPLKKDFPTVALTHGSFELDEVSLRFDATNRRVHWNVAENNHAVDRAWNEALGQIFATALAQVTWTRGSGGTFLYNNEYNQDSGRDYEGGGGTLVSRRFGPLGEDPFLAKVRKPSTPSARKPGVRR